MTNSAIKAHEREAQFLFERGVAAARGGQRRVAAGLLSRAVRLNPRHEGGWLWLSGVLDKPEEIAFCLRSVLEINPQNQRAQQGLLWLEQQGAQAVVASTPAPTADQSSTDDIEIDQKSWLIRQTGRLRHVVQANPERVRERELQERVYGESWWVNFRRTRRDIGRARSLLLIVPILLLAMTLGLNITLRTAVERNDVLAREAATAAAIQPTIVLQRQRPPDELITILAPSEDAQALAYLSAIEMPRSQLRSAVDEYRAITNRPGGSSVTHATAAQRLRTTIAEQREHLASLSPPGSLLQAHTAYLQGLDDEIGALDDMLTFYSSFTIEYANRATIRMTQADQLIERARQSFEQRRVSMHQSAIQGFTAR